MDEKKFILDSFDNNFGQYKDYKIAIYGLGKNTKLILDERGDYNIVALMDGMKTGEVVWNLPVITCAEVHQFGVELIIIIATSANVPVIYQRIAQECEEYKIKVFDINGIELQKNGGEYHLPNFYASVEKESLMKKIESCDVVSFDIFDTLLVRNILQPTDLFENLVNKYEFYDSDFCNKRIMCERDLYLSTNPNIFEIYSSLAGEGVIKDDEINKYVELEISEEKKTLFPRTEMVDVLNFAKQIGKKICCTSDMYIPREYLSQILVENGIDNVDDLFVSCEYRVSKCNGLFEKVKEKFPGKKIIHIGDNHDADILSAQRFGIDETFEIPSVYKMTMDSRIYSIFDYVRTIEDRNHIGSFVSNVFNNPFLFKETIGKIKILSSYEMGFRFIEPIIEVFLIWMIKEAKTEKIEQLLLGSRDGWLIKELLDIYQEYEKLPFDYTYFYASRAACTMAGIETDEDIKYAASLAFDGSMEEMLLKRFHLGSKDILGRSENETDEHYLERHYKVIKLKARQYRKNYKEYAKTKIDEGKRIGFFDFVSSGTCQLWLEKILNTPMVGIYFIRNYDRYKDHLVIKSLLKPTCVYEKQSKIYMDYVFLENILTSFEATLAGFDTLGQPIFEADKRTMKNKTQLSEIHRGIRECFNKRLIEKKFLMNMQLAEEMVDYVRPYYSIDYSGYFEENTLADEFCNRSFDLQQIVGAK